MALSAGYRFVTAYPQYQKEGRRKLTDRMVHGALNWLLLNPPEIWTANLYAVLEWPGD